MITPKKYSSDDSEPSHETHKWHYYDWEEAEQWSNNMPLYVKEVYITYADSEKTIEPRIFCTMLTVFRDVRIGKLVINKSLEEEDRCGFASRYM